MQIQAECLMTLDNIFKYPETSMLLFFKIDSNIYLNFRIIIILYSIAFNRFIQSQAKDCYSEVLAARFNGPFQRYELYIFLVRA